jgi:hypothetical protein
MDKKIIIIFAISQIALIGSLLGFASGGNIQDEDMTTNNEPCINICGESHQSCNGSGNCHQQQEKLCDRTGPCIQSKKTIRSCNSICEDVGYCQQNIKKLNSCNSQNCRSVSCNN